MCQLAEIAKKILQSNVLDLPIQEYFTAHLCLSVGCSMTVERQLMEKNHYP